MSKIKPVITVFRAIGKVFFVFAVISIISFIFIRSIRNPQSGVSIVEQNDKMRDYYYNLAFDKEIGKTSVGRMSQKISRFFFCSTLGETCTPDKADIPKYAKNSLVGFAINTILFPVTHRPASAIAYVRSTLSEAGFLPEVYAAEGVGFAGMRPFISLWKVFRNLSYLFLVLVLVIIGFLIMFRVKIDPQTVIGIENSIPRIIAGMIIISLSFAIAGFFIDMMYVITGLVISIMSQNGILNYDPIAYQTKIFASGPGFIFWESIWKADNLLIVDGILNIFPSYVTVIVRIVGIFFIYWVLSKLPLTKEIFTGELVKDFLTFGSFPSYILKLLLWWKVLIPAGSLTPLLISVLIFFSGFLVFLKIIILVFRIYIEILLLTIFAPIIILFSVIPGKNTVSFWLRGLIGNLLAFPVIVIMIMMSAIIIAVPLTGDELWKPPFLEAIADNSSMTLLIGTILLFLTPNAVKTVKGLVGAKGLADSGIGLGTLFVGATTVVGGGMGALGQYASFKFGWSQLRGSDARAGDVGESFEENRRRLAEIARQKGAEGSK